MSFMSFMYKTIHTNIFHTCYVEGFLSLCPFLEFHLVFITFVECLRKLLPLVLHLEWLILF